ncbi:cysteine proteinase [Venturia nashicola]|uniref:ubiquitinyl hydrolase 1 n=1 Tax=Venturia nashicola TaxID=86259 RepID=A0A4Z1NL53_9PEZI|nr:cysteine proteinase [Venturia nashicola]TLD24633.1 cysteine proteinase [Venturia nashicola]
MTSFLGRWTKGATNPAGASAGSTPAKKDPNAPQPTPLEKLLANHVGPNRTDGSDKFFGFENFGSTCYCNSIIQCLYYSAPFREQVINFPPRLPSQSLVQSSDAPSDRHLQNGLTSLKTKAGLTSPHFTSSPRSKQVITTVTTPGIVPKPEENKESSEYKKKVALTTGPVLCMDYDNCTSYGMEESLFTSLKDIFEAVIVHESRTGIVSPHKLLAILKRDFDNFRAPIHQDAHEFLNLLLNQVVENVEQYTKQIEAKPRQIQEVESANGFSNALGTITAGQNTRWVHELFEGTLTSETRCLTCENISQRDEVFLDLSVDLEQHSSVTSCLNRFSEEEMLCEKNKFHCDRCGGLQEAEKRMKIKRLPRILALHLKRFKYTEDMQRLQKLFHRVVYPYYLRLFNTTDDAEDPDRLYELYGAVVHIGQGAYHGHYVSIIKTQDRGWLLFDDEMVEPVDKAYVTKFFGEGLNASGQPNALATSYVLFYQETTTDAMQAELEAEGISPAAAASELNRDSHPTVAKANGVLANGGHYPHAPSTPLSEDAEHFTSLDHTATSPTMAMATPPLTPGPFQHTLEPTQLSPALPFLKRKKSRSEGFAKKDLKHEGKEEKHRLKEEKERLEREEKERHKETKERAKHEKEQRKLEERENERLAKLKRKEMEQARKENYKRQQEEVARAYESAGGRDMGTKPILGSAVPPAGVGGGSSNASSRAGDDEYGTPVPPGPTIAPSPVPTAYPTPPINRRLSPSPAYGLGLSEDHSLPPAPTSHPHYQNGAAISSPSNLPPATNHTVLGRFRNTSMSMRNKPKFWQSNKEKEKAKDKGRSSGEHLPRPSGTFTAGEEYAVQGPAGPTPVLGMRSVQSMPLEQHPTNNHTIGASVHPSSVPYNPLPPPPPPPVSASVPVTTPSYSEIPPPVTRDMSPPPVSASVPVTTPSYSEIPPPVTRDMSPPPSNGLTFLPIAVPGPSEDKSWNMMKRKKSGKEVKENGHGNGGSKFMMGRKKSFHGLLK